MSLRAFCFSQIISSTQAPQLILNRVGTSTLRTKFRVKCYEDAIICTRMLQKRFPKSLEHLKPKMQWLGNCDRQLAVAAISGPLSEKAPPSRITGPPPDGADATFATTARTVGERNYTEGTKSAADVPRFVGGRWFCLQVRRICWARRGCKWFVINIQDEEAPPARSFRLVPESDDTILCEWRLENSAAVRCPLIDCRQLQLKEANESVTPWW